MFSIALVAMPQVKAGKIRALGITSAQRSAVVPELPTLAEAGFPGFECVGWFGWLAPARVSPEIVTRLNSEIVRILKLPEMHERLLGLGADPVANSSQAFDVFIKSEYEKWGRVIKQAGIRAE